MFAFLSSLNLLIAKVVYSNSNVDRREMALYSRPRELMRTKWWPALVGRNEALINHGSPKHSRISNVFEPRELLIPIEPCPAKTFSYF